MGLRKENDAAADSSQYAYYAYDYGGYNTYSGNNYSNQTYPFDITQYYTAQMQYSMYANKAPTGIAYLDALLYGGLKRGEVYLIAGEAGLGKTIFSLKFLKTGADIGESGIYISVDEPSEDVKRGAYEALGWDLDAYEKQNRVIIYDFRTHFKLYSKEGTTLSLDPKDVARMIIDVIQKNKAKRVVVDPIAPLIITGHQDLLWVREYLRELVFQLKRYKDTTTLLTSEIPTGEATKVSRFGVEEYLAGGVLILQLFEEPITHQILRVMYIRKMRWMPISPMKLVYEIQRGEGIIIRGTLTDVLRYVQQSMYQYSYYPYPTQ
ncbi:ATPase domain-containing protein [Caldivirga sp.]|uniref:ATPase domain-containing protein n=1 Tax=Caldivirga sp. TaxID=2080243 RepID=UPI003D0DAD7A